MLRGPRSCRVRGDAGADPVAESDEFPLWAATSMAIPAARRPYRSRVGQQLIPVGSAPCRRENEQIPQRLDGADVPRVLSGIGRRVQEFRAPEVTDRLPLAVEHVQHGPLVALGV